MKLTWTFFSLLSVALADYAEALGYEEGFALIRDDVVWPAPNSGANLISSTFGPRILASTNGYDFHRGVDISGEVGDPIVASYSGVVERIANYASGGLTVILRHDLGTSVKLHPDMDETSTFYTLYMHCDEDLVAVDQHVVAGEIIATIGMSGSTLAPHLHHEIRLGTRCSLEWALGNPSSSCNTMGYDPHVHPMLVYPQAEVGESDITVEFRDDLSSDLEEVITITTPDNVPNVNSYKVSINNLNIFQERDSHLLDLSQRVGFDATSTAALDTQDKSFPYLEPASFGWSNTIWTTDLVIPVSWLGGRSMNEEIVLEVTDIWGTAYLASAPMCVADKLHCEQDGISCCDEETCKEMAVGFFQCVVPTPPPTPGPTSLPTPSPTPEPTSACENSLTWYKRNKPNNDCDWVSSKPNRRCSRMGEDGQIASAACPVACGSCP